MISLSQNLNVYFFLAHQFFFALIILQPETVKLNVTKSYILVDGSGRVNTGLANIFMREGRKSDIMDFLY